MTSAGLSGADVDQALGALRAAWGVTHTVVYDPAPGAGAPRWRAWRLGGAGAMITGETPDELASRLVADLAAAAGARLRGAGPEDPLARRDRFEAAHPEITIAAPETHASMWTARRGTRVVARACQLGGLLDILERPDGGAR